MTPTRPTTLPIDIPLLLSLEQKMEGIHYEIGHDASGNLLGKCSLNASISDIKSLDCSGFVRYVIYQSTHGQIAMCDGSVRQAEWCQARSFLKEDYKTSAGMCDGSVRIAFMAGHPGHVWLVHNAQTIESYSGGTKHGPGRRPWNHANLAHPYLCFRLTPATSAAGSAWAGARTGGGGGW